MMLKKYIILFSIFAMLFNFILIDESDEFNEINTFKQENKYTQMNANGKKSNINKNTLLGESHNDTEANVKYITKMIKYENGELSVPRFSDAKFSELNQQVESQMKEMFKHIIEDSDKDTSFEVSDKDLDVYQVHGILVIIAKCFLFAKDASYPIFEQYAMNFDVNSGQIIKYNDKMIENINDIILGIALQAAKDGNYLENIGVDMFQKLDMSEKSKSFYFDSYGNLVLIINELPHIFGDYSTITLKNN